jgi:Spy/CpxP family protein refolding chaperone
MPSWAATLAVGLATVLCNALLTAFYYGRLSERVDGHTEKLSQHQRSFETNTEEQRRQWDEIGDIGKGLEKIKGKLGVNGA